MTYSYADLKSIYREGDVGPGGDKWGECMSWLFAMCDEIQFNRDGDVPQEAHFRGSPMGAAEDCSYMTEIMHNATTDALKSFTRVLARHEGCLRKAGHSY